MPSPACDALTTGPFITITKSSPVSKTKDFLETKAFSPQTAVLRTVCGLKGRGTKRASVRPSRSGLSVRARRPGAIPLQAESRSQTPRSAPPARSGAGRARSPSASRRGNAPQPGPVSRPFSSRNSAKFHHRSAPPAGRVPRRGAPHGPANTAPARPPPTARPRGPRRREEAVSGTAARSAPTRAPSAPRGEPRAAPRQPGRGDRDLPYRSAGRPAQPHSPLRRGRAPFVPPRAEPAANTAPAHSTPHFRHGCRPAPTRRCPGGGGLVRLSRSPRSRRPAEGCPTSH